MTTPNDTPAGWYDDGSGRQRWWDGQQWGNFADEASAPEPTAPVAPAAQADFSAPAPAPAFAGASAPAYPGAHTAVAEEPKKKLNVLALVAAIVGAVGFIFACVPGALILGWILLPIAFILSIVALFLKGDKKWLAFIGLGLSIVGTIVGFVVFFAVVANSFEVAFGSGETTVSQPAEDESDADADAEEPVAEEPADAAQGTRENPYPVGSTIDSSDWTVVINSINPDGNATVSEANQFNDPAPAGSHYEIVNYTVTYKGDESGIAAEVQLAAVTASGSVINSYDALVALNDGMGLDELYAGGSATGSEAFLVPDGETVVYRITPGFFADDVFIK
ncbi:DUF2510 domain-containing protein [Microbacterium sp. NPDC087868]|uniref:DUF2510 domain-containing protein n=1 Tax=Microbacterium sp. NPDC087868 TaxID=3364195 RepID=UPI00384FDD6D